MYVCDKVTKDASIDRKGEKRSLWLLNPSRSEIRAACITRNFFNTQNPRLINESGLKSRATYDGACTLY